MFVFQVHPCAGTWKRKRPRVTSDLVTCQMASFISSHLGHQGFLRSVLTASWANVPAAAESVGSHPEAPQLQVPFRATEPDDGGRLWVPCRSRAWSESLRAEARTWSEPSGLPQLLGASVSLPAEEGAAAHQWGWLGGGGGGAWSQGMQWCRWQHWDDTPTLSKRETHKLREFPPISFTPVVNGYRISVLRLP